MKLLEAGRLMKSSKRAAARPKASWRGVRWPIIESAVLAALYAAPPASNGNGWRYDQPMAPCAACGTATTNRAPSGQPLHLACDTRTTTEGPNHG